MRRVVGLRVRRVDDRGRRRRRGRGRRRLVHGGRRLVHGRRRHVHDGRRRGRRIRLHPHGGLGRGADGVGDHRAGDGPHNGSGNRTPGTPAVPVPRLRGMRHHRQQRKQRRGRAEDHKGTFGHGHRDRLRSSDGSLSRVRATAETGAGRDNRPKLAPNGGPSGHRVARWPRRRRAPEVQLAARDALGPASPLTGERCGRGCRTIGCGPASAIPRPGVRWRSPRTARPPSILPGPAWTPHRPR